MECRWKICYAATAPRNILRSGTVMLELAKGFEPLTL